MPRIGQRRKRVTFQEEVRTADGGGGAARSFRDLCTVWGQFMQERGSERLAAGRLEASLGGTLRVRSFDGTRMVTVEHRVLIDDDAYQIRSITNPDQRNRDLEMVVEKGVAT